MTADLLVIFEKVIFSSRLSSCILNPLVLEERSELIGIATQGVLEALWLQALYVKQTNQQDTTLHRGKQPQNLWHVNASHNGLQILDCCIQTKTRSRWFRDIPLAGQRRAL